MLVSDLVGTLEQVKQEVRRSPRDAKLHTFLFQLFCVTAEWDRALTQLAVAAELDPLATPMAQAYQATIRCEMLRERVFAGQSTPTVFGEPAPWMSLLVEANRLLSAGNPDQAASLRDQAFDQAPAAAGTLDGEAFSWIADADPRLGPMLEAFVDGRYFWIPFTRLRQVSLEPPADLRDQVWMPADFTWANGGRASGFIPTRYPGSASAGAAQALSRSTEWHEHGDWFLGTGQRMFATDADADVALMDLRRLEVAEAQAEAA